MSSDRRDERKERDHRARSNETNRNDTKSIRCRIFVGNLATEELSRQEFEEIFAKHGRVIGCSVHNGYGFVQYEKESSADTAVTKEHGSTIKGKRVDVNLAGDRRKQDKRRPPPPSGKGRGYPGDRPRDCSLSPRGGRRENDDPFAIPGYREARDRYRDEHSDPSERPVNSPYGRGHDEVPPKKLRPDYDFAPLSRDPLPPVGRPVEAPIDCEIIIINKQQMVYAESVEKKLKSHGLVVECAHLPETVPLLDELEDASKRGVLFGIIISSQHEVHRSVTVHILHGTQQEHRNMPLEDAIVLVSHNFDSYMQALRDREHRPPLAADPLAPKKGYPGTPGAVSSVVPSPYTREVSTLLNIAADGRPLTVDEYTLVIDEFTKLRNDLLKKEGRVPPSPAGSAFQPFATDAQSIAQQQAELQAKILSILNPSTKPAAESKPATNNNTASVASSKPSIPVLTPSNTASTAFKPPSASSTPQTQTSNIIGMALSSIRSGTTPQSGTSTTPQGSTSKPSYASANPSYSGASSYSGYPSSAAQSQTWSQAQYPSQPRGLVPSATQHRGPMPSPQSARLPVSPAYPRYPGGQMNSHSGYRASYPSGYPPSARY